MTNIAAPTRPNSIAALRVREEAALADGQIDAVEAKELAAIARRTNTPEDQAALRDVFAHDTLARGVRPPVAATQAPIQGMALGGGVKIARTLGDVKGYATPFEALATARLSGAVPTAVVEKGGRFFAAQTTALVTKPAAGVTPMRPFDARAYANIDVDYARLSADDRTKKKAAMVFGVPESMVNVIHSSKDARAGVINVDSSIPGNKGGYSMKEGGAAGRADGKTPPVLAVSPRLLDDPKRANTVLFHEATHVGDHLLANQIARTLPKGFDPDVPKHRAAALETIQRWPGLTTTQRRAVQENLGVSTSGASRTAGGGYVVDHHVLEARAHGKAAIAALDGDPKGVGEEMIGFAAEMRTLAGKNPGGSPVFQEIVFEMKTKLSTLPDDKRATFDAAVQGLKRGHPELVRALVDAGVAR